jgi:hypothetical protein
MDLINCGLSQEVRLFQVFWLFSGVPVHFYQTKTVFGGQCFFHNYPLSVIEFLRRFNE